jgi:hypothetical protein
MAGAGLHIPLKKKTNIGGMEAYGGNRKARLQ